MPSSAPTPPAATPEPNTMRERASVNDGIALTSSIGASDQPELQRLGEMVGADR
jgi:hypothetical protein